MRELGMRCVSIHQKIINKKICFSAYWVGGKRKDITVDNMSTSLKLVATVLNYPYLKGIPVDRVNTHYLRGGGYNALYLTGCIN